MKTVGTARQRRNQHARELRPIQVRTAEALLNDDGEVVLGLANGCSLRSGSYDKSDGNLVSGEYVRLCEPDGTEVLYWDQEEWRADPAGVMGAIINSAAGLRLTRPSEPPAHDEPAEPMEIVVTVELRAGKTRRYVVVEDEELFDAVPSGPVPEAEGTPAAGGTTRPPSISDIRRIREEHLGRFDFGGRWLRGYGRVDEMFASLATWEVVKVERIPRSKVWGER